MNNTATLKGLLGTLRLTVLGYEFPSSDGPEDRKWLIARVEWESEWAMASHVGAILQTDELRDLARALSRPGNYGEHAFLEPSFAMRREPANNDRPERVTITIYGEARPGDGRFQVTTPVESVDVLAFGEGLLQLAEQFPERPALSTCAPARARIGLAAA